MSRNEEGCRDEESRARAINMRQQGQAIKQIAKALGKSPSTILRWVAGVEVDPAQQAALRQRDNSAANAARLAKLNRERVAAYKEGADSQPTAEDMPCIQWYETHGSESLHEGRSSPRWMCVSSDLAEIQQMIYWAIRVGHDPLQFSAEIFVPRGITASDDEIKMHWAEAGIPVEHIRIERHKERETPARSMQPPPEYSWGTCNMTALGDARRLYWYWRGQRDKLSGNDALKQESQALLEKLRSQEAETEESTA